MPILVRIIKTSRYVELQSGAVKVLASLARESRAQAAIRNAGGIEPVVYLANHKPWLDDYEVRCAFSSRLSHSCVCVCVCTYAVTDAGTRDSVPKTPHERRGEQVGAARVERGARLGARRPRGAGTRCARPRARSDGGARVGGLGHAAQPLADQHDRQLHCRGTSCAFPFLSTYNHFYWVLN